MTPTTADSYRAALAQLSPRAAQALRLRVLEGRSAQECAHFFGIEPAVFGLMLLRATCELEALEQPGSARPNPDLASEQAQARALEAGLAGGATSERIDRLKAMGAMGPEILSHLAAMERAHERSPAFKRETFIRRSLVLVVLLLTAFFYWRSRSLPTFQPRPPLRAR